MRSFVAGAVTAATLVLFPGCSEGDPIPGATVADATTGTLGPDGSSTGDPPETPSTTSTTTISGTAMEVGSDSSGEVPQGSSSSSEGSSGEESSSGGSEDIDLECEGQEGADQCDAPSPFEAEGECDPYAQDCAVGDKCMPWANDGGNSWNATRCSPVAPAPDAIGESCAVEGSGTSGFDSCEAGLMCWDVDGETNVGTCIALCGCGPLAPTCEGATICSISNDGTLPICLPTCDPLVQAECGDGQGCYQVGDVFQCAPDASGSTGAAGDACANINGCDAGLVCLNASAVLGCAGASCCTTFCDVDEGNGQCPIPGTACTPIFPVGEAPEPCHEDTGYCIDAD